MQRNIYCGGTRAYAHRLRLVDQAYFCLDDHGGRFPQTSAPHMIERMLGALDVKPGYHVLEIGTGSGYSTALLAELVGSTGMVVSIDVDPPVSERAHAFLSSKGYTNAQVATGDGPARLAMLRSVRSRGRLVFCNCCAADVRM